MTEGACGIRDIRKRNVGGNRTVSHSPSVICRFALRTADDSSLPEGAFNKTRTASANGTLAKTGRHNSLPQWGKVSPQGTDEVSFTQ